MKTLEQSRFGAPMCKESKTDSAVEIPFKAKTGAVDDTDANDEKFETNEMEEGQVDSTSCFGRGRKPKSGRELGVWESSLEDRSGAVSQWMLNYLTPLLQVGAHKVLDADDIGVPSDQDRADRAYEVAKEAWEVQTARAEAANEVIRQKHQEALDACRTDEEREKIPAPKFKEPSIALALVKGFGISKVIIALVYYVISAGLGFVPVLILESLVTFFETNKSLDDVENWYQHPWVQVVALGFLPITIALLQTRHSSIMAHCAVFVRTAVSTLLFRKSLYVSASGRAMTSTGQGMYLRHRPLKHGNTVLRRANPCVLSC